MPTRIKIIFQYKGTNYHGWQVQPGHTTVQQALQNALARILGSRINVMASGRTDAGVHALAQVGHFDWPEKLEKPDTNRLQRLRYGLNSILPDDIAILEVEEVPLTFEAMRSAKRKIYVYTLFNSPIKSPFLDDYTWRIPYKLDIGSMRKAAKLLVGEHDFKAFCASDSTAKTTVRKIFKVSIKIEKPKTLHGDLIFDGAPSPDVAVKARLITIVLEGNGFLKHMVRNIVGTLVDVGRGKTSVPEFRKVLEKANRTKAGVNAPAKGLMLRKVIYG